MEPWNCFLQNALSGVFPYVQIFPFILIYFPASFIIHQGCKHVLHITKILFVWNYWFLLSVSPLNPVIKETLDVKAGHMLSTAGIWCQWKEIESSFTWKYKNWPDPVYWGIEELARRACLVKDLKIKMGRIINVRSRSSGQLLESEGFACFCHSLPTKSNGNGSWRDCYRFSYKRKENVMYNV